MKYLYELIWIIMYLSNQWIGLYSSYQTEVIFIWFNFMKISIFGNFTKISLNITTVMQCLQVQIIKKILCLSPFCLFSKLRYKIINLRNNFVKMNK